MAAALAAVSLAACSGLRLVESDVNAYFAWTAQPPGPGTAYRFERLPSQLPANLQQDRLEALAATSLSKVGMVLDPAAARLSVQIGFGTQYLQSFPDDGFLFGGPGFYGGPRHFRGAYGYGYYGYPGGYGQPYYQRQLTLLMRDLSTQKIVFETHAYSGGVWADSAAVLPAMLDSALLGFPQPAPGFRRINVEIPRNP